MRALIHRSKLSVVPPDRRVPAAAVMALLDELLERPTDGGMAEWFLAKCGQDVRYVAERKQWALWDGRRWMLDAACTINERVKEAVHAIIDLIPRETSQEKQAKMLALGHRYDNIERIRKVLAYAQTDQRILSSIEQYDTDPWLLNCANGTVDLRDGRLLAPLREHMVTKIIEVVYEPDAVSPTWTAFLERIFRLHPEVVPFLQRAVGYSLTGSTREHKFWILHGAGRNGKSTFVETIRRMLGEYAQASVAETWLRQQGGRGADPEIARLPGVRAVTTAEIGEGRTLDEARVKGVVAGDAISTRSLYEKTFDFVPQCKLWISTNHAPQIRGNDDGMWRRVCLVPFDETITWDEMDRDLPAKLDAEREGILAWAVRGCLDWQRIGLDEPEVVRAKTDEYRTDQDIVGQFLDDECALDPDAREPGSAIFARYAEWARARGERNPLNATMFGRRLTDRGIVKAKVGGVAFRQGIRLNPDAVEDR